MGSLTWQFPAAEPFSMDLGGVALLESGVWLRVSRYRCPCFFENGISKSHQLVRFLAQAPETLALKACNVTI